MKMKNKVGNSQFTTSDKFMNVENLKEIIENISMCNARAISSETPGKKPREFNIPKLVEQVTSLDLFNNLDKATIAQKCKKLEESVKTIIETSTLVRDHGIKELVPLSYEMISLIFTATNEKFRQQYFKELTDYFYKNLSKNLEELEVKIEFTREKFDQEVKVLLPIIKLEVLNQIMETEDPKNQELLEELASNLASYIKYPRLNQEDIYVIVTNAVGTSNYDLLTYSMEPLNERNGHLGDYFKLQVSLHIRGCKRALNLFAKFLTPKLESMKKLVRSGPSLKEEFFYMEYLPLLEKEGLKYLLDFSPRCYFSRLNDVLILDDCSSMGYISPTPNNKLEYNSLKLVIKKIAKFHASTMILEEILSKKEGKKVSVNDIYEKYLKEVIFIPVDDDTFLKNSQEGAIKNINYLASQFPEVTENYTEDELEEKIRQYWKLIFKQVSKSDKFLNTMCHGDMYLGNMMFKLNVEKTYIDAILVDFQILRYCPPAHDLLFFIMQNTFKETRDKHYGELVDFYYSELSKHFEDFGLDVSEKYPKKDFEESLKYMKSQAVLHALYYSPIQSLNPKIRENIFENKNSFVDPRILIQMGLEEENYRSIMKGLIKDLIELFKNESI